MTSARDFQSDSNGAVPWDSCGLWSLWKMVANFRFGSVYRLMTELSVLARVSSHNMKLPAEIGDQGDRDAIDQALASIKENSQIVEQLFSALKSGHINSALNAFEHLLDNGKFSWSELNTRVRSLRNALEVELREHYYYQYPKPKGLKLSKWTEDWKISLSAFPNIRADVYYATDCYASGHDTASVFHSMRIAEHGLRALAKERRVKLPKNRQVEWATWQDIIKALDHEITAIGNKKAGAARDAALEFYSGARADLNGFKDEYRNLVMHVRATYDEYQALRALTNVNAFMERIAAKIDHRHHRIRWGLR